jgi:hypothetical protein
MDSTTLRNLLVDRLTKAHANGLELTIVTEFVGISDPTPLRWIKGTGTPRGENLNRLWHLLSALGLNSPELKELQPYSRYLGELLAYRVISLGEEENSEQLIPKDDTNNEGTLLEILGLKSQNDALRIVRGEQQPTKAEFTTVEELEELYGSVLEAAKAMWKERFAAAAKSLSTKANNAAPVRVKPEVVEIERPPAPAAPPATTAIRQPATTGHNYELLLKLAGDLSGIIPMLRHVLSDACTDEERAQLRDLLGQDQLFVLMRSLQRLTSSRAFREGEA